SRSEGDPKEGNRSTRTELVSNRSSAELAETAVHDVRLEDVLAPAGHGRPLVQQLVLEDQRQAPPRRDRPFLDHRLAAGEPLMEIDEEREEAHLAIVAPVRPVAMGGEPLAGVVPVEPESLVEPDRLTAPEEPRDLVAAPLPERLGPPGVVDDD